MSSATRPNPSDAADDRSPGWRPRVATGVIVLADGAVIEGFGVGATGSAAGEVCFNTAMTGYEEILTDPSYAAQIVTFTFPHIGIVGVNDEDIEVVNAAGSAAVGAIMRADVSAPSNFRAKARLDGWLKARGVIGVTGVDTRALDDPHPRARHAERRHRPFARRRLRPRRAARRGRALARHRRHGPGPRGGLDPALRLGRDQLEPGSGLWPAAGDALSRGRDRLRDQAQHPQAPQRLRLRGDGGPGDRERRGHPGAQARRGRALQRTRRPGGDRRIRGADDQGAARGENAAVRHLSRPSAARARGRRAHPQNAAGPSRRQSSGEGLHDRQGRDRVDEPRLRRRSRDACRPMPRRRMCRCSTARIAALRLPTVRPSRCNITPRPRPDRATATISSAASST